MAAETAGKKAVQEEAHWDQREKELEREILQSDPIVQQMRAVRFTSYSRGQSKGKRRHPKTVILLQYGQDRFQGRWRSWSGSDHTENGRTPWDQWATEIFGQAFCESLSWRGTHPSDYLRHKVLEILARLGGRF